MDTPAPDFFRTRLDGMVDPKHPLVILASRVNWPRLEAAIAPLLGRQGGAASEATDVPMATDLFGARPPAMAAGPGNAGRPRLPSRLLISLLYLKHSENLSDGRLVQQWGENVVWQHFSGMEHYEPRLPCDATQIGRFRQALGEEGLEHLLKATIETAVQMQVIEPAELEHIIVDTTVQEKAVAHPGDSRLLEIARHKVVNAAKGVGIALKQTFKKEGKRLGWQAGRYAHARQFGRMHKAVKRQRTILGKVMREVQRKLKDTARDVRRHCGQCAQGPGSTGDFAGACRAHSHPTAPRQRQAGRAARPRGPVHRQGQGPQGLRVRGQGESGGDAPAGADGGGQEFPGQSV